MHLKISDLIRGFLLFSSLFCKINKMLSCPLCLKPHFQGVDALRSSLISVATSQISCPVCNEHLLGLDKLTIHLFSHITHIVTESVVNNVTEQQNKSKIVNDREEKEVTVLSRVENDENLANRKCMRCDICNFCFSDENILEMHQKLLHKTSLDIVTGSYCFHCHLCSKKFKMKGSLMVHLRVAHYGFGHHSGDGNCSNHSNASNLINDKQQQSRRKANENKLSPNKGQDNKQWECDVCSKLFTTKYFLKKHKRLHTGEMPYYCGQCNKSFTFQQSYHKHMLYHSSEKPHVCNECGRAFKELSTLHNHERIHSGERPFACETCGKKRSTIQRYVLTVFFFFFIGKCFRQRVSYLVHKRIHTGVMPYKCNICNKTFRYKVSQRSHKCIANSPGTTVANASPSTSNDNSSLLLKNANIKGETSTTNCMNALIFNEKGEIISQNFCLTTENKNSNSGSLIGKEQGTLIN